MEDLSQDIFSTVKVPPTLQLDISSIPKGIDNYHIDVKLSARFCQDLHNLITQLLPQEAALKLRFQDHEKLFEALRRSYLDMMTVLVHRVKTELSATEINLLQFAVSKYTQQCVRDALKGYIDQVKERSSELRSHGSGEVLGVQQHLAWLSKNFNAIFYAVNSQISEQYRRVELKQLQAVRRKYLQQEGEAMAALLLNPMLLVRDLTTPLLLLQQYMLWTGELGESQFNELNASVENLLQGALPELETRPLKQANKTQSAGSEIYDELGGLVAGQSSLGAAEDMKSHPSVDFCWLDEPDNIPRLFAIETLREQAPLVRKAFGMKAWWRYRSQIKRGRKVLHKVAALLSEKGLLGQLIASEKARHLWSRKLARQLEPRSLCLYLSGQLAEAKLLERAPAGNRPTEDEMQALRQTLKEVSHGEKHEAEDYALRFLQELARYRGHLKQHRFTHRLYNRLQILRKPEDILLSKQANTLYQLPTANEVEDDEAKIVHHAILKADVRGSTTVTEELENKGLNPASYFSLRFFNPINELLPVFGANKVFIEGDAIILSFLEYEHSPQQWFSVAHACGLAKGMLNVVQANNLHSRQMGLPPLELGIGICYADYSPRFLFDGDHPIMISSAIGLADRMSSCSWHLRQQLDAGDFNVAVLEIAAGERERGEKGQEYLRYNVNGILLENEAFAKLQNEISLSTRQLQLGDKSHCFHYGTYLDKEGKKRDLVIREGKVGLWQDDRVLPETADARPYYEVLTDPAITARVLEKSGAAT